MALSPVGRSSHHSVRKMIVAMRNGSSKNCSSSFFLSLPKYSATAPGPYTPCAMAVHELSLPRGMMQL